jgi:uncharacterized protein YcbK (DUF882 family)
MKHSGKMGDLFNKVMSRRGCLKAGLVAAVPLISPFSAIAAIEDTFSPGTRELSFYNLHTKEDLNTVYYGDGQYIPEALDKINYILRDHYCGAVRPIDTKLLDLFFAIRKKLDCSEPFHIISGYRTVRTNLMLSKRKNGVARKSFHIKGKAADIRIPGFRLRDLRRAAYEIKLGGVGYYPKSNFVHVDVGWVRYWWG